MKEAHDILGNICVDCGTKESLEIDHKDWRDKSIKLNRLWSISKPRFLAELSKCTLRCNRCHIEKSKKDLREIAASRLYWGVNDRYK